MFKCSAIQANANISFIALFQITKPKAAHPLNNFSGRPYKRCFDANGLKLKTIYLCHDRKYFFTLPV